MKKIVLTLALLGSAVFADLKEAMKECDEGNALMCLYIGDVYSFPQEARSSGVKLNATKAIEYFSKVCNDKSVMGCEVLGEIYYQSSRLKGYVKKDLKKALTYFKKACDSETQEAYDDTRWLACYNLGVHNYNTGRYTQAAKFYKRACDLGGNNSMVQLIPQYSKLWHNACSLSASL